MGSPFSTLCAWLKKLNKLVSQSHWNITLSEKHLLSKINLNLDTSEEKENIE